MYAEILNVNHCALGFYITFWTSYVYWPSILFCFPTILNNLFIKGIRGTFNFDKSSRYVINTSVCAESVFGGIGRD